MGEFGGIRSEPCDDCHAGCAASCARTDASERHPEHELALILDHARFPSDAESEAA